MRAFFHRSRQSSTNNRGVDNDDTKSNTHPLPTKTQQSLPAPQHWRKLSLDNDTRYMNSPDVIDQLLDSTLFRVPREIRIMIYQLVLDDRIKIDLKYDLDLSKWCWETRILGQGLEAEDIVDDNVRQQPASTRRGIRASVMHRVLASRRHSQQQAQPISLTTKGATCAPQYLLSLLLTCRQIYSEAITLFYSTPTFVFPSATMLHRFPRSILSKRFNVISSLHLTLTYPTLLTTMDQTEMEAFIEQRQVWRGVWGILLCMEGLKELIVTVEAQSFDSDVHGNTLSSDLLDFVEYLRLKGNLKKFVLLMNESWVEASRVHVGLAMQRGGMPDDGFVFRKIDRVVK